MARGGNALGVAMSQEEFDSLTVATLTATGTSQIGNAAADLVAFHDASPCDQSDTCSALSTSTAVAVSGTAVYGFATAAQAEAIATAVNLIRACLREKGLMA